MIPICVLAAVIRKDNKIFAAKGGCGEFKGRWEFPGGKNEPHETERQTLAREIKEELDAEIRVGRKIDIIEYDYPDFHLSMDCFWCELENEHVVLKEHEAAKWFSAEELDSMTWLPADQTIIEKIKSELEIK